MSINYPHYDGIWIAVDGSSNVAAFITAAVGPIPKALLLRSSISIDAMESRLCELPKIGACIFVACDASFQGVVDLTERGFYVYDWSDVHRTSKAAIGAYEVMARPTVPLCASDLPPELRSTAHCVQLRESDFATDSTVDVRRYFDCIAPPW